jgi:sporulation protein YlmC with PRC-barrel domain
MKPDGTLKLVAELLDLPIRDLDGRWCGVVDDVELSGTAGKETRIAALLVGPGAYEGRLPPWCYRIVRWIAGDRLTRVPIEHVKTIHSAVKLKDRAEQLGLHETEDRVRRWIPRKGAL